MLFLLLFAYIPIVQVAHSSPDATCASMFFCFDFFIWTHDSFAEFFFDLDFEVCFFFSYVGMSSSSPDIDCTR